MIRHAILTVLRDWERWAIPFDERSLWVMVEIEASAPGTINALNRSCKREDQNR